MGDVVRMKHEDKLVRQHKRTEKLKGANKLSRLILDGGLAANTQGDFRLQQ